MPARLQRVADRQVERIVRRPLQGAWTAAATVTLAVTVVAGVLIRLTDPNVFPSVWLGLWWSVQTTTTVGYGDVVPSSVAGRIVATVVMVGGIGFITVSTAAIASAFIEASRRRGVGANEGAYSADLQEIRDQIAALADEVRASRPAGPSAPNGGEDSPS